MSAIKPCPFCGGDGRLRGIATRPRVECKCGACGPRANNKTLAVEAWNKRQS